MLRSYHHFEGNYCRLLLADCASRWRGGFFFEVTSLVDGLVDCFRGWRGGVAGLAKKPPRANCQRDNDNERNNFSHDFPLCL